MARGRGGGPRGGAVGGPAAAGKGTLARRLAGVLGVAYLDTGLLYRAAGRMVLVAGGDPADGAAAERAALGLRAEDLARGDLRGAEADAAASLVAAVPGVRAALLAFQRQVGVGGAVLDGRDIGTVVFPDARVKLFVTASPKARARRRWLEVTARGEAAVLGEVAAEMAARDARDAARAVAPLRPAEGAVVVDTTEMDADAVFARALEVVRAAGW